MLTAIIGIVFGILCICLGRWVYRNSTKVLPTIIFNPESPLLHLLVRLSGSFVIFGGVLAILIGATSAVVGESRFAGVYNLAAILIAIVATRKLLPSCPPLASIAKKPTVAAALWLFGVICVFVTGVLLLVFGLLRNSDVCSMALQRARTNQETIQLVGEPIKLGLLISGSIQINGPSGHADIQIPISGPKGKANIYAVANRGAGRWDFETLEVATEDAPNRVDLLKKAAP